MTLLLIIKDMEATRQDARNLFLNRWYDGLLTEVALHSFVHPIIRLGPRHILRIAIWPVGHSIYPGINHL